MKILKNLPVKTLQKNTIYLLVFLIFFVSNLLINSLSLRFDFSKGRAYTLSLSTKKIIKKLDDVVNIKFFVSSDLPTRLLPLKTEVVDLLNEYKKEARGKIILKIIDPKKDSEGLNQAREIGVPELQFSQLEKDKYQLSASYFGIGIFFSDKKEVLPQVTDIENLEYNLTASIYKLTKKELVKIAIIGSEETVDPKEDGLYTIKKILTQQYLVDTLNTSSPPLKKINPSYKTVLLFDNNKKTYEEAEVTAIKDYFNQGGKIIFFVDGAWVLNNLSATKASHNLFSLLEDFGIKLNEDLVLSTSAELVNFGNDLVQFLTSYPFWVKTNSFNKKTGYFTNINQLTYPWVSSLTLNKKSGFSYQELIKTTKKSWVQKENFVLNPQNIPQPQTKNLRSFLITVQLKNKHGAEAVIIPCSRFVAENYLNRNSDNLEFVLNLVDNLASEGALSGIRARAISFYPLPDLSENQKDIFKYLNIFLLPGLFSVYGVLRTLQRR